MWAILSLQWRGSFMLSYSINVSKRGVSEENEFHGININTQGANIIELLKLGK